MEAPANFLRSLGIGIALTCSLAACGGGDSEGGGSGAGSGAAGGAGETETVQLGVIPIVDVAPVYLGMEQGFFEEQGIDLQLSSGQGGAAIIPGVVGGSLDIGFGNNTSLLLAASQGLPLKVITSGVYSTGEAGADYVEIVVSADNPIESAAGLAGKTVAVNTLKNLGDTSVRSSVDAAGGASSAVNFVEMPFPSMNAALAKGEVDAIWQVEPFLTLAKQEGDVRVLASPLVDTTSDLMVSTYFATAQYTQENPEVVRRFKAAIDESMTFAQENPEAVREIIPTYLDIPPEVVAELTLPGWDPEIATETFDVLVKRGLEDGLFDEEPDIEALLP